MQNILRIIFKLFLLVTLALSLPGRAAFAQSVGDSAPLVDTGISAPPGDAGPAIGDASSKLTTTTTFTVNTSDPLATVTTGWDLIKQSGWIWGGMAILFGFGTYVIKKNEETHWLGNDHILAAGTTLIGVLGAVTNAHFGSGSYATVVSVLVAGVALIIQKPQPAGQKAP